MLLTSFDVDTANSSTTCQQQSSSESTPSPVLTRSKGCNLCDDDDRAQPQNIPHDDLVAQPPDPDMDSSSSDSDSGPDDHDPAAVTTGSIQQTPAAAPPTRAHSSTGHSMINRAKAGVFKTNPKYNANISFSDPLIMALHTTTDPRSYKIAAKETHWIDAMKKEMTALARNNTWTLVPRPQNSNVVGSKWLFRTKFLADGSIDRYKARLVAQGFSQVPGLDFFHTFSPVVKATTVRTVLALAMILGWKLRQLDVNNAFLHGNLTEQVFMEQPQGFINPTFPNHVCRLNKALYGLKQAPRAWFHRLSTYLTQHGFTCSRADPSLFVYKRGSCIMYLLVYFDDLILTGNNEDLISKFVTTLNLEFAIKDLGCLGYFLGLEVTTSSNDLFLCQTKYAHEILERANLLDAKPMPTPLAPHVILSKEGEPFQDQTLYRSLVGALQYLTITRPDISYAVNQVSQFLQNPTTAHYSHVKRILRSVKGTTSIRGYSDADWARCIETRRSTYGYSIFIGGNLVSWSAKKQPSVARSSCESEYRAMANTAAEIIWLTHLLRELHVLSPDRPTLLCDNQSALFMSQNPVSHKRAKHIDLDYHFVRELVTSGKLYTKFVPTKLQVADIFTKSLPRTQFESFRDMLSLGPPPLRLRGDVKQ